MAIIKCKMCGGDLVLIEGQSVAECEYCGSKQTVPAADNEKKLNLFTSANKLRLSCEFDRAAGVYDAIKAEFPSEAESYWGLVLCKYGIEYVDDPATGRKVPTCHRLSFDSVMDDNNLELAMDCADAVARKVYREEAKNLEKLRTGILEVSSNEKPYDIFICYKETDENGDRTLDSVLAQDLYSALTEKGYRVFFSRITLQSKLGEAYEPYIFAALNSAKVMLAIGTDPEYYSAVWVKNEWSRYLKICAADKGKYLIPCYKDMDAYDMPKEFRPLQGVDLGKMGAVQDILFNMEKYIPLKKKNTTVIQEKVVVGGTGGSNKIASLLDRGNMALEDGDWAKADSFFEDVLNNDSKNAQAYIGKTLAQERCRTMDALVRKRKDVYQNVGSEKLYIQEKTAHINKMAEQFSLAGYVEQASIRELYWFDLSYTSEVSGRQKQYREEENWWQNHKLLSRAEKFAVGAVAEHLQNEKKHLFTQLNDRVKNAQEANVRSIVKLEAAYDAHIVGADKQAEELYQDGCYSREANYRGWLEQAKRESNPHTLRKLETLFEGLGDYKDSKNLAEHCRKRAADEQAKLDAEAERQRIIVERQKKAQQMRRRNLTIVAAICAIFVVVVSFVLLYVILPENKYKDAMAYMEAGQIEEAYDIFQVLGDYKDAEEMAGGIRISRAKSTIQDLKVGDYINFGNYEQDNDSSNGKEDIEWLVLYKQDNHILVISKYVLDSKPYNVNLAAVTWETCTLREWLNGEFMDLAFSDAEKTIVDYYQASAHANPKYSTNPGNETLDQVFLLSIPEAEAYFFNRTMDCKATEYAVKNGAHVNGLSGYCWWWLRTPGRYQTYASGHHNGRDSLSYGSEVNSKMNAVRPAMWINLSN